MPKPKHKNKRLISVENFAQEPALQTKTSDGLNIYNLLSTTWSAFGKARAWAFRNPLKSLTIALALTSIGWLASSRNRTLQDSTETLPCNSVGLEKFVPKDSPAYHHTLQHLQQDCRGLGLVSPLFVEANANAYSTEFCMQYKHQLSKCNKMKDTIKKPEELRQITLNPKMPDLKLIHEGSYGIVDSNKNTIATARISFCVAVAITSPDSPQALLAHINAESIQGHDEFLKGKFEDPFSGIRKFVTNQKSDLKVTLASGSSANLAYVKTVLEKMGLSNIDSYCEPKWARKSPSNLDNQVNNGSLVVQHGKAVFIQNTKEIKNLIQIIPTDQKRKAASLVMK